MDNERVSNCADRISQALYIRGMKQADLRRVTKIPKSSMSQYMSGDYEPKQDRIYIIAKALNVSEAWLMGYDVPMERQKNISTNEADLTEGEQMWLELFRRLPESSKPKALLLLDLLEHVPEEKQEMLLDILQVTLKKR